MKDGKNEQTRPPGAPLAPTSHRHCRLPWMSSLAVGHHPSGEVLRKIGERWWREGREVKIHLHVGPTCVFRPCLAQLQLQLNQTVLPPPKIGVELSGSLSQSACLVGLQLLTPSSKLQLQWEVPLKVFGWPTQLQKSQKRWYSGDGQWTRDVELSLGNSTTSLQTQLALPNRLLIYLNWQECHIIQNTIHTVKELTWTV